MALVNAVLSAEYQDSYGIASTTNASATVDDTKTVAQMITDVIDWENTVSGLTQASEIKSTIRLTAHQNSDPTPGTGDIEKGSLFNFNNASDGYAQGYWIPDVNPSILTSTGLIDLTNTNVTDFITFMTTAHTAITIVTKGVRALTALRDALISFRKHRKPLERKTKEV